MQWLQTVLKEEYVLVNVLRDTDKMRIHHLRHKTLEKDIVLLSFCGSGAVYRLLQGIQHENLPRVYEVIEENGNCTVLEEYVDGTTVAEILKSGLYTEEGVRGVVLPLCDALCFLHSVGVIHRDVKPENVMVTTDGRVVLIDFDTARRYKTQATKDTVVIGTAGYAAPEQFGITQTDERADIFALGIMMNVMLTGAHPSKGIAKGGLGRIIQRCTRIDPQKRYRSVRELKNALQK